MDEKLPDLELEIGDKVEHAGIIGEVYLIKMDLERPIAVRFKQGNVTRWFFPDGRQESWNKISLLRLVEKKIKPKTKIKLYRYTYKLGDTIAQTLWTSSEEASFNTVKTEMKYIEID